MKYLLKNGTVVTGEKSEQLDILVEGEKIVQVGKNLPSKDAQEIDVSGKILFPGFIDGHTHFDLEVAGTVTADDFETGTKAAILGGTTFVIDYASQDKGGHTLKEGLDKWHKKADDKCSFLPDNGLLAGSEGYRLFLLPLHDRSWNHQFQTVYDISGNDRK